MDKSIRTPKQQRSIDKKNLIKTSALKLISENGYHNTSTNEIAKAAGISIGTLYSYFKDKKDIYKELVLDLYEGTLSQIDEEAFGQNVKPYELIHGYVEMVLKTHEYMTNFQKEIASLTLQYEEFYQLDVQSHALITNKLMTLMVEHKELLRVSDFSLASLIVRNSIESVIHEVMFHPNDYDKSNVIDEITNLLCNYLFKPEYL